MPVLKDEDFVLPAGAPPRRRGARQDRLAKEPGVDPAAIQKAVKYLDEAEAGARELTREIEQFAAAAQALLKSRLTEDALVALLQPMLPRDKKGNRFPMGDIMTVLKTAARLHEYLKAEGG